MNNRIATLRQSRFAPEARKRRFGSVRRIRRSVILLPFVMMSSRLPAETPAHRPNLLLVMVDDMGYSDLGCYGGEIQTPNIDALARDGVRLARFYNCAQCCPSRASLLTGLYPHQAGMGDMNSIGPENPFWAQFNNPSYTGFKKEGLVTLPEVLKAAGYQTFMSGKWHLGDQPDNWPSVRGFDRTFSLIPGACEHFTGRNAWQSQGPIATFIFDGKKVETLPDHFYSTDTFTDYALQFLSEAREGEPWFLYLAYTAPHWPYQAPEADAAKYEAVYQQHPEALRRKRLERMKAMGLVPETAVLPPLDPAITGDGIEDNREWCDRSTRQYAGMIDRVDQNIGRLVARLKERGELDHTLILLMSDNGADEVRGPLWGTLSNAPFRRYKVWTYDGGIATPFIAHWPDGIPAGRNGKIVGGYGHFIDVQPTLLAAAHTSQPESFNGHRVAPLEGVNLLPALRGDAPLPSDRPLFWERQGNEAVRLGDWKLVRAYNEGSFKGGAGSGRGARTGRWELYSTADDPGETCDLADRFPEKVDQLISLYAQWSQRIGVIPREEIVKKMNH